MVTLMVKPKYWPSGYSRTVAVLSLSPQDLEHRASICFTRAADDLDALDLAVLNDPVVGQLFLQRYLRSPESGTELLVDAAISRSDALDALKRQTGLHKEDLAWLTELESDPRASVGAGNPGTRQS